MKRSKTSEIGYGPTREKWKKELGNVYGTKRAKHIRRVKTHIVFARPNCLKPKRNRQGR